MSVNYPALSLSERTSMLPVIHGSGDFAIAVRRLMLEQKFDCLAVPLPPSFKESVLAAVEKLPAVSIVVQPEPREYRVADWTPEEERLDDGPADELAADELAADELAADELAADELAAGEAERGQAGRDRAARHRLSYVPIDPCQPVIAAIRIALQERMAIRFVDLETTQFRPVGLVLPDPYAIKQVRPDRFAASVLPVLPRLPAGQPINRCIAMAQRLRELEQRFPSILFLPSLVDWPWIREAYTENLPRTADDEEIEGVETYSVDPNTLTFLLGELPYITGLYERARTELDPDENLSIDGIKALFLEARDRYKQEHKNRARKITPKLASTFFHYVRNLSLIDHRFTPDLYTLIVAGQQIFGDAFAISLAETARDYPLLNESYFGNSDLPVCKMGVGKVQLPDGDIEKAVNRLPGPPVSWRSMSLNRRPPQIQQNEWRMRWNPYRQCSWPPEDTKIENFRNHVKDVALKMMGSDLARTEKFTTSLMDGLDIRETLRNWHTGDLYVKIAPPTRGSLDCVLMLFDSPADPRDYPWRLTWHAEHQDESTLSFFASNFLQEVVGPGICQATYGGCMFLFPPRPVPEVWQDPRFDFCDTLEERLLAAGCYHSQHKHIAVLSESPPGIAFRKIARRFGRKLVHVPLRSHGG